MKDKFGRLNLKAESKPSTFSFPIKIKTYVIRENKHTTNTVSQTPFWAWLLIGGLCALVVVSYLKR
jgi:hypothetical protein